MKKHRPTTLFRDTRGAVMAEGVVVLPVFVITLAAILYFHHLYVAKLERNMKARSCAWTYAVHGCDRAYLAEGCKVSEVTDGFDAIGEFITGKSPFEESQARERSRQAGEEKSDLDKGLAGANQVGLSMLGLREGIQASYQREVARPSVLGGGKASVSSNYTVMCNEKQRTPVDLVVDSFCAIGSQFDVPGC